MSQQGWLAFAGFWVVFVTSPVRRTLAACLVLYDVALLVAALA